MRKFRNILCLVGALLLSGTIYAQKPLTAKQTAVKQKMESKQFRFVAQYANPQRGGHRYLTSDYDIRLKTDSLIGYLPYFGRAYFDVPYNPSDGGLKFTSTKFESKTTVKKKGGWQVVVIPKDVKYLQRLIFDISVNGSAYAQAILTNRDPISFDGYIDIDSDKK